MKPVKRVLIAHAELYRWKGDVLEFLILKRTPEDGGFWQPITGTIEDGEAVLDCLHREIAEEAGVYSTVHVSDEICHFDWEHKGELKGRDLVYAVEVDTDTEVVLDGKEHTEYKWLPYEQAAQMLKFETNKDAMNQARDYILSRAS